MKRPHPNPRKSMKHGIRNGHSHAGKSAPSKRQHVLNLTHGSHQGGIIHER